MYEKRCSRFNFRPHLCFWVLSQSKPVFKHVLPGAVTKQSCVQTCAHLCQLEGNVVQFSSAQFIVRICVYLLCLIQAISVAVVPQLRCCVTARSLVATFQPVKTVFKTGPCPTPICKQQKGRNVTYCVLSWDGKRGDNEISIACPCRKTMCIGTVDPMLCLQRMDVERTIRSGGVWYVWNLYTLYAEQVQYGMYVQYTIQCIPYMCIRIMYM